MAKKIRDKDSLSFREATAYMSRKEKIGYIWEYYRWIILGIVAIFLVVTSMMYAFLTQMETHLYLTFLSGFEHTLGSFVQLDESGIDLSQIDDLPDHSPGIWVDYEIASTLENLLLDNGQLNNYEIVVQNLQINFQTIPAFRTHTSEGVIDIIITYAPDLHTMTEIGHFKNISELGWDIPTHQMHNEYAVYLGCFPIFNEYVMGVDNLVLGIATTTRNIENIADFFDILLD